YGPAGLEILVQTSLEICGVRLPFDTPIHAIPAGHSRLFEGDGFQVESAPLKHRTACFGFFFRESDRPGRFFPDRAAALGVPAGPLYKTLQSGEAVSLSGGAVVRPEEVMGPPRPGRLIAYCTDTAPCRAVVTHARNADLLIHDSTFSEGMETEARISGHSTAAQAASQARAAGCRRLALFHLSVRYEDDRPLVEQARAIFPNSFAAADLLVVDVPTNDS
ncbi:MAG: ribonuclease Z, partial [Chloroflexi bacterium]|nr:ribonuclease Z [Chloroflexota bacterium]